MWLVALLLVSSIVTVSYAAQDSVVVGRLFGSTQPLPGFFRGNITLMANKFYPEFLCFRFVNSHTGKKIKMRPESMGYFFKSL